jgi:ABC-type dipeptide/oligopeptide/nickel transport system permease component
MLLALSIALPLGIMAAVYRNSIFDRLATLVSVFFQSIPNFWLGLMLIIFFSVWMRWLPTGGMGTWQHLILPSITLAAYTAARIVRLTRTSLLEVLYADYIRTARAKGVTNRMVLLKHALKNAAIPIITVTGLQFGIIFGGAVITETIFSWPGLGRLIVQSIEFRDFPVLLAGVFVIALMFSIINLISDLLYVLVNPEIRLN